MAKQFLISEELANEILQYLCDKPYKEVHMMADGLIKLEAAPLRQVVTK